MFFCSHFTCISMSVFKISKKEFFSLANVTICCTYENDFVRTWTTLQLLLINFNNAKKFLMYIYILQTICMRNICVIRHGWCFIVVEMNMTTTLILGKVLVHSEDCKRSFFLQAVHIYTKSAVTKNQ